MTRSLLRLALVHDLVPAVTLAALLAVTQPSVLVAALLAVTLAAVSAGAYRADPWSRDAYTLATALMLCAGVAPW